jgi:hypothetical protein
MNKPFTFTLPDEPYKTTTAKNDVVHCVYTGSRYITLDVTESDGIINSVVEMSDILSKVGQKECRIPGHKFVVVEAWQHLVEAANATGSYTHADIPDYVEQVPGGEYSFTYAKGTGVIGQVTQFDGIRYSTQTNSFLPIAYRTHVNTRESTMDGFVDYAGTIAHYLSAYPEFISDEDQVKLANHANWLKQIPVVYANVDHWKIPFPIAVPNLPVIS